jgi:hypothetical protein
MKKKTVQRVSGMNWQGRSFTLDLAPLTAIIGPNMEGKSSVPHAMRVGLTGYSPAHGKKAGATFGFIGSENGATKGGVELGFDDGASVNRLTWETKRGKIEAGEARMDVKVPPVLLDLKEEFFKLSGPKRTDFIFGKMDMATLGFAVEEITARLKKDVKVKEPTPESETVLADIITDVEEADRDREDAGQSYQEFIAGVCDKIKARADSAANLLDQMAGLIQGTTVLQGSQAPLAPFNPDDLAAARQKHADLTAQRNNAERHGENLAKLNAHRPAYVAALGTVKDHSAEIAALEKEIEELDKQIAGFKSTTKPARLGLEQAKGAKVEAEALIEAREKSLLERNAELAEDQKAKCCPKCKSKGKTWEKLLAAEAKEIEAERKQIAKDKAEIKKLDAAIAKAEATVKEREAEDTKHQERQNDRAAKSRKANELRLAGTAVKVQLPAGPTTTTTSLTVDAIKERIKSIDEQLAAPGVPPAPAPAAIDAAKAEVERLEALERAHSAKHADSLRAEEGRAKHATAAAEKEVATLAGKVMQALKAEMMDKAFEGFLAKVNRFITGLFKNTKGGVTYRDGEIGYLRGATWVSLDHFSGTEEMLTYIGLSVALAEESPCRIVFVDEWLRDDGMREKVAARLAELVKAEVIDQAIVIDTNPAGYAALGFKTLSL